MVGKPSRTLRTLIILCIFGLVRNLANNVHVIQPKGEVLYPTIFLIGGMAQTRSSWEHQLPALSKNRKVVVYECIGQGQSWTQEKESSDLVFQNVSLPFQAEKLLEVIQEIEPIRPVDLVGFSFGARVSMACACIQPDCIRKLHLTGVATERSDYGKLAVKAWKDSLQHDHSLRSFAWSILMATYSPSFLQSQPVEKYVDHISKTNSRLGLMALLNQAEVADKDNPWHVANMAKILASTDIDGKILVGEYDLMAPQHYAAELCKILGWKDLVVVPNAAHAVGLEGARHWKNGVLEFLNVS